MLKNCKDEKVTPKKKKKKSKKEIILHLNNSHFNKLEWKIEVKNKKIIISLLKFEDTRHAEVSSSIMITQKLFQFFKTIPAGSNPTPLSLSL